MVTLKAELGDVFTVVVAVLAKIGEGILLTFGGYLLLIWLGVL